MCVASMSSALRAAEVGQRFNILMMRAAAASALDIFSWASDLRLLESPSDLSRTSAMHSSLQCRCAADQYKACSELIKWIAHETLPSRSAAAFARASEPPGSTAVTSDEMRFDEDSEALITRLME